MQDSNPGGLELDSPDLFIGVVLRNTISHMTPNTLPEEIVDYCLKTVNSLSLKGQWG